jgi:hypothetical protein
MVYIAMAADRTVSRQRGDRKHLLREAFLWHEKALALARPESHGQRDRSQLHRRFGVALRESKFKQQADEELQRAENLEADLKQAGVPGDLADGHVKL